MSIDTLAPVAEPSRPARARIDWRKGLFGSPVNIAITLAYAAFAWWLALPFLRWAVWEAHFSGGQAACQGGGGACWSFIGEKLRFILFGLYPATQDWRPALACAVMVALALCACRPRLWGAGLLWGGLAALAVSVLLLSGFPGALVPTEQWGGLPVTLFLSITALAGAFPLAVLLALGRRSRQGGVRLLAVGFIEIVRGVPFISLLYLATLLLPLMLPQGASLDKFIRAQLALILFVAAYLAEIIRAGLQSVPAGQDEAARALGLSYTQTLRRVILPQALRAVIPAMVNLAIGIFQDTTLVLVIGMFDFLNTARVAASDPNWLGYYDEAFVFAAIGYFAVCFSASRYSLWLERYLGRGRGRLGH